MRRICHMAWETGIMRGFSGNASVRLPSGGFLITASGVAKGRLKEEDILEMSSSGEVRGGRPSLEKTLHLALYGKFPACCAILHTHPVWFQALEQRLKKGNLAKTLLNIDFTEADYWRERLVLAPEHAPGSPELAQDATVAVEKRWGDHPPLPCAVWLCGHGLCALAENLERCLGLSEQLEHIAHVQWASL